MEISQKGLDFIKNYEGCILKCYLDSGGIKTAGYGTTGSKIKDLKVGDKITKKQAEEWLKDDINNFTKQVLKVFPTDKQCVLDSNISFAYNCGCGALSSCKLMFKKRFLYVKDAKANRLYGLVRRRNAEFLIYYFEYYTNAMYPIDEFLNKQETLPTIYKGNVSGYTTIIQLVCGIDADGINGPQTQNAVKLFQKNHNLVVDGIVGKNTWKKMKEVVKGKM